MTFSGLVPESIYILENKYRSFKMGLVKLNIFLPSPLLLWEDIAKKIF